MNNKKRSIEEILTPRECRVCGNPIPYSMGSAKVCSEECRKERQKQRNKEASERRKALTRMILGAKQCAICSKVFEPRNSRQVTCSRKCQKIRDNSMMATWKEKNTKSTKLPREQKPKKKKPETLAQINKKARELGMTYGQYTAYLAAKGDCSRWQS